MIKDCKDVKADKKDFEYLSGKRKKRQNRGLLLSGAGGLWDRTFPRQVWDTEYPLRLSLLFSKTRRQEIQARELSEKGWKEYVPLVEGDQVREYLGKPYI